MFATRPLNVAVCVCVPIVAGLTIPESVVLPADAVPTTHENSVPVADGPFVAKPCTYTVSARADVLGASVTSSFESPSALCPLRVAPSYTNRSRSVPVGVIASS